MLASRGSTAVAGLSPRLRGNATPARSSINVMGSIPALAGERESYPFLLTETRVYPRACGGTHRLNAQSCRHWGLSPRLRGNAQRGQFRDCGSGSIPALAGERGIVPGQKIHVGVYPRACGGTPQNASVRINTGGLSPRLRGNVHGDPEAAVERGSIPALAGERL